MQIKTKQKVLQTHNRENKEFSLLSQKNFQRGTLEIDFRRSIIILDSTKRKTENLRNSEQMIGNCILQGISIHSKISGLLQTRCYARHGNCWSENKTLNKSFQQDEYFSRKSVGLQAHFLLKQNTSKAYSSIKQRLH